MPPRAAPAAATAAMAGASPGSGGAGTDAAASSRQRAASAWAEGKVCKQACLIFLARSSGREIAWRVGGGGGNTARTQARVVVFLLRCADRLLVALGAETAGSSEKHQWTNGSFSRCEREI